MKPVRGRRPGSTGPAPAGWVPCGSRRSALGGDPRAGFAARIGGSRLRFRIMPLDRQSIEKRDFPIGRRGYEPEAVDAFLAQLANEVDALQRAQQRRTPESLAQAASDQVRAIVEAAESSAADIERAAEEEAAHIRSEAARDAERTRNEAIERARDHV